MKIDIGDAYIRIADDSGTVELWRVQGIVGFYPTKLAAEKAARLRFPSEDTYARYARLYLARFTPEVQP